MNVYAPIDAFLIIFKRFFIFLRSNNFFYIEKFYVHLTPVSISAPTKAGRINAEIVPGVFVMPIKIPA